ncbi:MAG: flippase-like domain-containing protein, partial [Acidobacteria bacterium]|nr:flippase-like domain-containing protein [Acidobacteriota bacterium]
MKKKSLRRWIWLGVSTAVLALIFYNLRQNPEWRHFDWNRLWNSLVDARPGLLVLALVAVYVTYLLRAYRWQFFMKPMKTASLWVLFVGQVLGFSSIYLVGRPGEFVRPAYIAKKERVPITSMVAVWLLERIFDSVCLVLLFSIALFLVPMKMMTSGGEHVLTVMHRAGDAMLALTAIVVAGLVAYRLKTQAITGWVLRMLRFLPRRLQQHMEHFMASFAEGLQVVRSLPDFLASTVLTVILWCLNATIFWLVLRSMGDGLEHMIWMAAALVMFCASMGLVVQFPGIGGGYQ